MAKLILVTVGTSALFNEYSEWQYDSNDDKRWEKPEELIECLEMEVRVGTHNNEDSEYQHQKEQVLDYLKSNLQTYYDSKKGLDTLSAELASLLAMHKDLSIGNITDEDKIVLLHSDTADGKLCAETNAEVIQSICANVLVRPLVGIRVQPITPGEDIRRSFVIRGLNSIQNEVRQAVVNFQEEYGEDIPCYMNITGGYKGMLPFTTVLALSYDLTLVYLYEESEKIIWIKPSYLQKHINHPDDDMGGNELIPI